MAYILPEKFPYLRVFVHKGKGQATKSLGCYHTLFGLSALVTELRLHGGQTKKETGNDESFTGILDIISERRCLLGVLIGAGRRCEYWR